MTVTVTLAQFKREKEAAWGRDISWQETSEGAGISRNPLARLLSDQGQRVDNQTTAGLCRFFDVPPGPEPFIVFVPDRPDVNAA